MDLVDFRVLGRGGFSVVYLAEEHAFARRVAVKVLHNGLDDPKAWARFENECRLAGQLSGHPGVVTLHTAGRTVSGAGYIVMEYLPGGSIARLVRDRGALLPSRVVAVGRQIAEVLAAAHDTGTVHRDVKPENILLTHAGDAKLGDFGISALLSGTTNSLTSSSSYTPDHVAPEVLRGHPADRAADVYSFCSTLYQLLTASPPHRKAPDEPVATLLLRKVSEPIPPLPDHVPTELAALLIAGLASEPSTRPSARELAVGLAALPADALWAPGDGPSLPLGPVVASPLDDEHLPAFADTALTIPRHRVVEHQPDATPAAPRRRALVLLAVAIVLLAATATATALAATRTSPRAAGRERISTTTLSATTSPPQTHPPQIVSTAATTDASTTTTPATSTPDTAPPTTLTPTTGAASADPAAPEALEPSATTSPATLASPSNPKATATSVAPAVSGTTRSAATTTTPAVATPTPTSTASVPTPATPAPTAATTTPATPAPTAATTPATPAPTAATTPATPVPTAATTTPTTTSTVARATFAQGDANGDGIINCADVKILELPSVWNTNSPLADFNHDGTDDINDLFNLLAHVTPGQTAC